MPAPVSPLLAALYPELYGPNAAAGAPSAPMGLPGQPDATGAAQEPPPPAFISPELLAPHALDFRQRLAAGLANYQGHAPAPYESGGSRFTGGLVSGLARGFSTGTLANAGREEAQRTATNAKNQAAADRANFLSGKQYEAALTAHYKVAVDDAGKFTVTPKMAADTGLPVGSRATPTEIATRKNAQDQTKIAGDNATRGADTLAETIRHNRATEDAARFKAANDAKSAGDTSWMQYLVGQTSTGNKYVDLTNVGPKDKPSVLSYAGSLGVPAVTPAQKSKLASIDDARANIADMLTQAGTFLEPSTNPVNTGLRGLGNIAASVTGTNPIIKAWPTWRVAAIQQLVALAGGMGSGLRINQAEIRQATENDIPKIVDNLPSARQKAANILALLDNAEKAVVGGESAGLTTKIGKDGLRHIVVASPGGGQAAPVADPFAAGRK